MRIAPPNQQRKEPSEEEYRQDAESEEARKKACLSPTRERTAQSAR
jgi:hypothetical protein